MSENNGEPSVFDDIEQVASELSTPDVIEEPVEYPIRVIESSNYETTVKSDTKTVRELIQQLDIAETEQFDSYRLELKEVSINRKVYTREQFDEEIELNPEMNILMTLKEKVLG